MIDLNPANWNKENICDLPLSKFINPSINSLINGQCEELDSKKFLKINKISGNNEYLEEENFKVKRGRFEIEEKIEKNCGENENFGGKEGGEDQPKNDEAESLESLYCWWAERQNFRDHKAKLASSRCLFPITQTKQNLTKEIQNLESSSKEVKARIVLGELFCYVLSPFKNQEYSDEEEEIEGDELPIQQQKICLTPNKVY
ncbi:unnamed protein product [Meloidogyne enterolobii]|uniref:Uncharacterized protein n=1 Tax=Meloidogyne enterolobii TaxID=390850 RepID=A0ACB0YWG1_MELEN